MHILGIETSCDETSAALVENGRLVLSNTIRSSQDLFSASGGVIPEAAARAQVELMLPVLHACLREANISSRDIDAIAVTAGPGLLGSLLVGTVTAQTCAALWKKPLIGVHHTLGHLSSPWLTSTDPLPSPPKFPCITLSVSGGHTDLWRRESHTKGLLLGQTRDDAAGEAFDKGAALLGLGYPGGPAIAKAAEKGDENRYDFPLPLSEKEGCDFSFSGLKTALRYLLENLGEERNIADVAASYEYAICRHLCDRIKHALAKEDIHEVHLVGGVAANSRLRIMMQDAIGSKTLRIPETIRYCTDNAAMIAAAGYFLYRELGEKIFEKELEATASMQLDTRLRMQ